jgi:tetratricopeptide (TPR) repeat protein
VSDNLSKDNVLFTVIGLLLGFISGYLLHEVVAARQPPRLRAGMEMAAAAGGEVGGGTPVGEGEAAQGIPAGGPPMKEIQELREYVESHPDDAEAIRKLANLNFDIRNWTRALELYERYLKLKPNDADAISDVGFCFRELKQFDKALAEFRRAQVANPNLWQSFFNEVVILGIDQNRFDEADKALAKLRKMQPNNADIEQLAANIARRRAAG